MPSCCIKARRSSAVRSADLRNGGGGCAGVVTSTSRTASWADDGSEATSLAAAAEPAKEYGLEENDLAPEDEDILEITLNFGLTVTKAVEVQPQ